MSAPIYVFEMAKGHGFVSHRRHWHSRRYFTMSQVIYLRLMRRVQKRPNETVHCSIARLIQDEHHTRDYANNPLD